MDYDKMNDDELLADAPSAVPHGQEPIIPSQQPDPGLNTSGSQADDTDEAAHTAPPYDAPTDQQQSQPQTPVPEATGTHGQKNRQRSGFFKKLCIVLLILILIVLLPIAGLLGFALIDRTNPAGHIPDGSYALVCVLSASDTLQKGLYLSTADALLSAPETAAQIGNRDKPAATITPHRVSMYLSARRKGVPSSSQTA